MTAHPLMAVLVAPGPWHQQCIALGHETNLVRSHSGQLELDQPAVLHPVDIGPGVPGVVCMPGIRKEELVWKINLVYRHRSSCPRVRMPGSPCRSQRGLRDGTTVPISVARDCRSSE